VLFFVSFQIVGWERLVLLSESPQIKRNVKVTQNISGGQVRDSLLQPWYHVGVVIIDINDIGIFDL